MEPQSIDVDVRIIQFAMFFACEIGWEACVAELVFALDFAFGLGCGSIKKANVVELQCRAQLGEGLWVLSEEDAVIIDLELEWSPVGQEGGGQEIQIGQEELPVIDFGADEEAAAIVEHDEHGEINGVAGEPRVRGGIQVPEFGGLGASPATN